MANSQGSRSLVLLLLSCCVLRCVCACRVSVCVCVCVCNSACKVYVCMCVYTSIRGCPSMLSHSSISIQPAPSSVSHLMSRTPHACVCACVLTSRADVFFPSLPKSHSQLLLNTLPLRLSTVYSYLLSETVTLSQFHAHSQTAIPSSLSLATSKWRRLSPSPGNSPSPAPNDLGFVSRSDTILECSFTFPFSTNKGADSQTPGMTTLIAPSCWHYSIGTARGFAPTHCPRERSPHVNLPLEL